MTMNEMEYDYSIMKLIEDTSFENLSSWLKVNKLDKKTVYKIS